MKLLTLILMTMLLVLSAPEGGQASCVELGTIQVEVEGYANKEGLAMIALDNRADDFDKGPLSQANYQGKFLKISSDKVVVVFRDVPYGTYAIKAFHDANSNTELDKNLLGIPSEAYGFSKNARGIVGPPSFKEASFELREPQLILKIQIK